MKKRISRVFALLLALCMVCSLLPVAAFAARTAVQPTAAECKLTFEVEPAGSGKYSYTYFSGKAGQGEISETTTLTIPANAQVTAYDHQPTSDEYQFVEWQLDGVTQADGFYGCEFYPTEGEHTFKAIFKKTSTDCKLTLKTDPEKDGGTLTVKGADAPFTPYEMGEHRVDPGTKISLKPEPAPGYVFEKFLLNNEEVDDEFTTERWDPETYYYTVNGVSEITAVFKNTSEPEKGHVTFTVSPDDAGTYAYSYSETEDTVSKSTEVDIPLETEVVLKNAEPSENYTFVEWRITNKNGTTTIPANAATKKFTVTGDTKVEGVFEVTPVAQSSVITLKIEPEGGGTYQYAYTAENYTYDSVTSEKQVTIPLNTFFSVLNPKPAANYEFVEWKVNGESHENGFGGYGFYASENAYTVTAVFKKTSTDYDLTLEVSPEDGGTLTATLDGAPYTEYGVGKHQIAPGKTVSLEAKPADGYVFEKYLLNGDDPGDKFSPVPWAGSQYFYTVDQDSKITAVFKKNVETYKISLTAKPTEGGTVKGDGEYEKGKTVTIEAKANDGYTFVNWTEEGGQEFSTEATKTFEAEKNLNLVANFQKNDAEPALVFDIYPEGAGSYTYYYFDSMYREQKTKVDRRIELETQPANQIIVEKPEPADGFQFVAWDVDGARYPNGQFGYTVNLTGKPTTIKAIFEKTSTDCKITTEIRPGEEAGSLKLTDFNNFSKVITDTVESGTKVSLEAQPNSGYTFVEFLVDGQSGKVDMEHWPGATIGSYTVTSDVTFTVVFQKDGKTYTISLSAKPTEGGKVDGAGSYAEGDSVTIKAEANDGYTFVNWTNGEAEFSKQAEYTFDATEDLTLVANFEKESTDPVVTLDITPPNAGTFEYYYFDKRPYSGTVTEKKTLTLTPGLDFTVSSPAPAKGYEFVEWDVDGEKSPDSYYGKTVNVTKDTKITAIFKPTTTQTEQYTVTVVADPEEGGTVTGGGTFDKGTSVTVTAEAKPGYQFEYWTVEGEGNILHYPLKYTFELQKDTKLTAHFRAEEAQTFHVSLSVDPEDVIYGTAFFKDTEDTEGDFAAGTHVTVVAEPVHEGATFLGWREKEGTEYLSRELEYSFDVEKNVDLVACFTDTTKYYLTFTATPTDGGYLARTPETVKDDSGNDGFPYYSGQEVLISGIAWDGYRFDHFVLDGATVPSDDVKLDATGNPTYTFTVTGNHHVEAVFTPLPTYTLTLIGLPTGHCSAIALMGSVMEHYPEGTWVTVRANVEDGYTFLGWYDEFGEPFMVPNSSGGTEHMKNIAGTFPITKDTVLVAVAVKSGQSSFTVEAAPNLERGGSVSVTPEGPFEDGDEATVKAVPSEGYRFLGWSEGDKIVSTSAEYTFKVRTDRRLVALFKLENPRTLTVSVSANPAAGGFVTGGGEYEEETMATVVAQANAGYHFVKWEEDGQTVSEEPRYTFLVTDNRNLVAVFAKDEEREFTVTLDLAGGSAPYALTYQVVDGASFIFPAAPTLDGFVFQGWKAEDDPKLYLTGERYVVTGNVTFTAQWAAFRPEMHRVIVPEDGSVIASPAAATAGAEIILRVQPKPNYFVHAVLVRDAFGDAVAVTALPDGTYRFLMPNSDATVLTVYHYGCDGGLNCPSIGFTDFDASQWYHEGIDFAVRNGLINGMENNTVQPDTTLTRGMLVTMLYRYAAPDGTFENPFTDVANDAWYAQAVAWAAANGIVNGVGDNKFEPDRSITREELVTVLYRYAAKLGRDVSAAASLSAYPDANYVSPYAEDAMRWAVATGIVNGKAVSGSTQVILEPLGNATRAEVATMLMRFLQQ